MDFRTPKCTHNQKGMCIHCMVKKSKSQKTNNNMIQEKLQLKVKCKHPVHMKCLKCLPSQTKNSLCNHPDYEQCKNCQNMIKYQTFQQYIQKLNFDCKHKKPCFRCVPPLSRKTYFIDKSCKKHLPYPQAQCDSCMAPTITIQKQIYAHVTKVKIQTLAVLKLVETKLFGILLGNQKNGILEVQDIYFPQDQDQKYGYISPEILTDYKQIFDSLNYKQVGIAYASSQITSMGLMISSIFQQYFLQFQKQQQISRFVTMRLQFDEEQNIEPHFQCFMVSDQFQAFHKNNIIYEKQKQVNYFDLITAKNDKMSEMPTFLREGVQTDIIYFRQIVTWIPTVFNQQLTIGDPNLIYPFFKVQAQTIDKFKIFISVFHEQPWQKYRNIQFLLHMHKLFGKQSVLLFLSQFLIDNPQLFLKQKIKQYESIERGRMKELQNPNIYDQYKGY